MLYNCARLRRPYGKMGGLGGFGGSVWVMGEWSVSQLILNWVSWGFRKYLVLYHIPNLEQTTYVFDNICTAHFSNHQTPRRSMQSLSFTLLLLLCDMCPPRLLSVSVVFFLFRNSRILLIRFIFVWQGSLFTDIHHLKTIVITYVFCQLLLWY